MNRPVQSTKPTSDRLNRADRLQHRANQHETDDAFERPQQRPRGGRTLRGHLRFRALARRAEMPAAERILNEPEHHADACGAEAKMPVDDFTKVSTHQRSEESADVDAHVVDRKSRVAARAALGIQIADDRADVRLQQPGADDDEREADVERDDVRNGEREVAQRDDGAAPEHRAAQARAAGPRSIRPAARRHTRPRCRGRKSPSPSRRPGPCRRSRRRWS